MEFLLVAAAIGWAFGKAIEYASKETVRRGRAAASAKWQSSKSSRPASKPGRVGSAVGRGIGAGLAGASHGGRGFFTGLREGYPVGRQAAYDWAQRREAGKVTPLQAALEPAVSTQAAPSPAGRPDDVPAAQVRPRERIRHAPKGYASALREGSLDRQDIGTGDDGLSDFRLFTDGHTSREDAIEFRAANLAEAEEIAADKIRETGATDGWLTARTSDNGTVDIGQILAAHDGPDGPVETPLEGETPMSTIDTITGGEVLTMNQLISELQAIQNEAVAELEDATSDAQRAKEDAQRVELMVSSLATLKLDEESLGEIGALAEDASQRLQAAEQRQGAAESRAAHAEAAAKGVQSRHSLMQEAVDSTPGGGAERAFYQRH